MNILFLQRLWPVYGGGETVTICLANEMVKRGWNVGVLYFKYHTRKELPFIDSRIDAQQIEGVDCNEFHQNPKDAYIASEAAKKYIDGHQTEYIINQWWEVPYIKELNGYKGAKMVKCLHCAFYILRFDLRDKKALVRTLFKSLYIKYRQKKAIKSVEEFLPFVDKYIFLSSAFEKQYKEMSGNTDKNQQLYSINNPATFNNYINDEDINNKEDLVLVVARMEEEYKRLSYILKAWKEVENSVQLDKWKLEMVGDGRDLENYKKMAIDLDLKRVKFEGFRNPEPWYKRAKVFLMSSVSEGFGMTLIEAQQYGAIPIVMDTFLALHDIIKDNENGCITSDNLYDFTNRLTNLLFDEEQQKRLAINAIENSKRFAVSNIVDQWETLLKNI